MDEQEFISTMLKFIDACAGEGIGQEIDGRTLWADELLYSYFNELKLQRKPFPNWVPYYIKESWE